MTERFNPLVKLTLEQLQEGWNKADETAGEEVEIEGVFTTKGWLSLEMTRRATDKPEVTCEGSSLVATLPILRRRQRRNFFNPIDGSSRMGYLRGSYTRRTG